MMSSSITAELWEQTNILFPGHVRGDVINVLDDLSLPRCAVYCLMQVSMCFMFEFNVMAKVCRLYSGIANQNGTHLSSWTPFLAYRGRLDCERSGYIHAVDEGLCFKMFVTKVTWHAARTKCEEDNGRLVVLTNPRQTGMLMQLHQGNSPEIFWIGLRDPNKDSNWQWVDGTTFNSSVWHRILFNGNSTGYPSEFFTADCAVLNQQATSLFDVNCKAKRYFVCERPQLL